MAHLNAESMANILSLKDLASVDGVRITMDTKKERSVLIEFLNTLFKCHECDDGLYYLDLSTLSDKTYCIKQGAQGAW